MSQTGMTEQQQRQSQILRDKVIRKVYSEAPVKEQMPRVMVDRKTNQFIVPKSTMEMMMAVSKSKTIIYYKHDHFCEKHKMKVDRNHINQCDLIHQFGDVTQYNDLIQADRMRKLSEYQLVKVLSYFAWLQLTVEKLIQEGVYTKVK